MFRLRSVPIQKRQRSPDGVWYLRLLYASYCRSIYPLPSWFVRTQPLDLVAPACAEAKEQQASEVSSTLKTLHPGQPYSCPLRWKAREVEGL